VNNTQGVIMRISGIVTGFTFALMASVPAWAADAPVADLCAVSELNGKIHGEGGLVDADDIDSDAKFQGVASLSLPLGCLLGLQIDAGAGSFGAADALGIGGHLFMRDPQSYLFGIHGTYENWDFDGVSDSVDVFHIGAEAEVYLDNISLEAWAGLQDTSETGSDFFGRLTAAAYVTDDLRLAAGWRHSDDFNSGVINGEWQLSSMPLSMTAEGEFGEDGYMAVTAGIKFYFGGAQKSLIERHRQDDPVDGLFDFIGAAAGMAEKLDGGPVQDGNCNDGTSQDNCCIDGNCEDEVITDGELTPFR
jgi:hypothetical protein